MTRSVIYLLVLIGLFACSKSAKKENPKNQSLLDRLVPTAVSEIKEETENLDRFYFLTQNIMVTFEKGDIQEVKNMIEELNQLIPIFQRRGNEGNAVHKINLVQGRIALLEGNINEAKDFLIKAGKTKGSPNLNTFGPNMTLAEELLLIGERKVVIEYLDLCKLFWEMENGRIEDWKEIILKDQVPKFGAHLVY